MSVQFARRTQETLGLSRRATLLTRSDQVLEITPGNRDDRIIEDRQVNEQHREELRALLENTLAQQSIEIDESQKSRVLANIIQIHQTVSRIRENYLDLGKCLLRIYRDSAKVYEEITRKGSRILPFDYTVAIKCRRIAEAVEGGLLAEAALPASYTTAYEIATMDETTLRLAEAKGLVRADVSRSEIVGIKKAARGLILARTVNSEAEIVQRISQLEARKTTILAEAQARVREIELELDALRSRIG